MAGDIADNLAYAYELYLQLRAAFDPVWATEVGIHVHDHELTRWDDSSYKKRVDLVGKFLKVEDDSLDGRLWRSDLLSQEYEYRRHDERTDSPGLPFRAVSAIHDMLVKDYAPKEGREANVRKRLELIPDMIAELRGKLGRPPKVWTQMAIDDGEGVVDFLAGLNSPRATDACAEYVRFLKEELLPRSDGEFAVGRETYEFHLKNDHFLDLDADGLEEIGRREFDRTVGMLEEIDADWPATLERMKRDHPQAGELLDVYLKASDRARQYVIEKDLVRIPEGEKMEVIETPPFFRSSTPYAAYSPPGPLDASRIGHFYVTPAETEEALAAHNVYDIPGTVWHEAYPGHHLQFVYAKDIRSKVRKLNDSPLLSEGWGFYCEELAHEQGYFRDPRERLMQLNWRLQRTARVILDVSLHVGRMSWEQAVAFLVEKVRMNRAHAEGSVNAYTRSPTYFATYLLGMLEIFRIREACRSRLGPRFSLREFHERFLRYGNVPPALIERELSRDWA